MIYFEAVSEPEKLFCNTPVNVWHVLHGWFYHVWECSEDGSEGRIIGGFYVTLLCGAGGVLHFDCYDQTLAARPMVLKRCMQKGFSMVKPRLDVVMATIPSDRRSLIACARRMGFRQISSFNSNQLQFSLLQYLKE